MESVPSIIFPHLGIKIGYFPNNFYIGKFSIAFYGVIIAISMVVAVAVILHLAKKTNQSVDDYVDLAIITIIFGIVGARIYYVLFSLDYYIANPGEILNLRGGGIAIYGGLIGAFVSGYIVCRVKKLKFLRLMDTALPGVVLAQCIGRWANFVNREAFGEYTDSLFAMQIRAAEVNSNCITDLMQEHMVTLDGVQYVQVSPTFLYESLWCLLVFVLIMVFRRFQRYNGEVGLWYIGGYALGRAYIEGLRTDALYIGHTGIAVSQLLSVALVAGAFAVLLINRIRLMRKTWTPEFYAVLPVGYPGSPEFAAQRKEEKKQKQKEKYAAAHGEEKKDASSWETYTVTKAEEDAAPKEPAEAEDAAPKESEETENTAPVPEKATEAEDAASEPEETAEAKPIKDGEEQVATESAAEEALEEQAAEEPEAE